MDMPKPDTETDKLALRNKYRMLRKEIVPDLRQNWDERICKNVLSLPPVKLAKCPFIYVSMPQEVDTHQVITALDSKGVTVLSPSCDITKLPEDGLCSVKMGIEGPVIEPYDVANWAEMIDLVIVPGIAWDKRGYRVGFGGGYFDRLLAGLRPDCVRVGLAYSIQVVEKISADPWDEPVNWLVTEESIRRVAE